MTQKEATRAWDKWMENGYSHSVMPNSMALVMAYNALRGPTREQVEAWRGEWVRETTPELLKKTVISHCSRCWYHVYRLEEHTKFCPVCGAPMTDEAVDIIMQRLEALKDETKAD